jgi:hypothetical protein
MTQTKDSEKKDGIQVEAKPVEAVLVTNDLKHDVPEIAEESMPVAKKRFSLAFFRKKETVEKTTQETKKRLSAGFPAETTKSETAVPVDEESAKRRFSLNFPSVFRKKVAAEGKGDVSNDAGADVVDEESAKRRFSLNFPSVFRKKEVEEPAINSDELTSPVMDNERKSSLFLSLPTIFRKNSKKKAEEVAAVNPVPNTDKKQAICSKNRLLRFFKSGHQTGLGSKIFLGKKKSKDGVTQTDFPEIELQDTVKKPLENDHQEIEAVEQQTSKTFKNGSQETIVAVNVDAVEEGAH